MHASQHVSSLHSLIVSCLLCTILSRLPPNTLVQLAIASRILRMDIAHRYVLNMQYALFLSKRAADLQGASAAAMSRACHDNCIFCMYNAYAVQLFLTSHAAALQGASAAAV